jgi:hypothetical protein
VGSAGESPLTIAIKNAISTLSGLVQREGDGGLMAIDRIVAIVRAESGMGSVSRRAVLTEAKRLANGEMASVIMYTSELDGLFMI